MPDTDEHGFSASWSYLRITTVLPVALQMLLIWPYLLLLNRLLPRADILFMLTEAMDVTAIRGRILHTIVFLMFNLILVALSRRKQTVMLWQPVMFLTFSAICFLLIGSAYEAPSVAPMILVPVTVGYTVLFSFMGLTTIPSSVILFCNRKREERKATPREN
ncbi:MAG: hypothetical protein ACYDCO_08485 [Armatimonadota bacterium]